MKKNDKYVGEEFSLLWDKFLNEDSVSTLCAGLLFYIHTIEESLDCMELHSYKTQHITACVLALKILCENLPFLGRFKLRPREVKKWKQAFLDWTESKAAKIPKNKKEEFVKDSIELFDVLIEISESGEEIE